MKVNLFSVAGFLGVGVVGALVVYLLLVPPPVQSHYTAATLAEPVVVSAPEAPSPQSRLWAAETRLRQAEQRIIVEVRRRK